MSGRVGVIGTVYLIHFDRPFHHAQHYLGWSENVSQRFAEHLSGTKGSRLLLAVRQAGIPFKIVRTWPDTDRNFERRLHNARHNRRLCPVCNPAALTEQAS